MNLVRLLILLALSPEGGATAAPPAENVSTTCGHTVGEPARLPPADSSPIVLALILCFERQGGVSLVDPATYLHYIQVRPNEPSRDNWIRYDAETERVLLADFRRLWNTAFLDDLSISVESRTLINGVTAKIVVFNFEERQRVKIVDFKGSKEVSQPDIENALKDQSISVRLDSFLDAGTLRRVSAAVRELYAKKGYQFTTVEPRTTPLAGGPKLVNLTFNVDSGPKVAIRDVEFVGKAFDDATLAKAMEGNKSHNLLSLVSGRGVYRMTEIEEESVVGLYRDHGYIDVRVGQPDLRTLEDSEDRKVRWVQLTVLVNEGRRYRVGTLAFDGNTKVPPDRLLALFKIRNGEVYSDARIRKGLEKARELYGAGGYFEFTAYPDLQPRNPAGSPGINATPHPPTSADEPPIVDVTVRVQEGEQYFVRRIDFVGNTNTKDEVIRRELAIVESGVFNTEALKHSVRRLNQLGYFKPLKDEAIHVEKVPNSSNKVDIELKVEEQNRNQISIGAGASQYDGFYGNASFTTSNFMGRGESLTFALQKGARTALYQFGLTEPFLFDRPITAGLNLFSRKIDYAIASDRVNYSEVRTGASFIVGYPVRRFTRLFNTYRYEVIDTAASDELLAASDGTLAGVPFSVLQEERRIQSSIEPALVHDTVDNPYTPRRGVR